jgi:hypothetical protein
MVNSEKIYTYQIEYDGIDGIGEIQFCTHTEEEAIILFNNWCREDNHMEPVPIKAIYTVYNDTDHDIYGELYAY